MKMRTLLFFSLVAGISLIHSNISAYTKEFAVENQSLREQEVISHVKTSIENAEKGKSKITPEVFRITGPSSPKVRHFLNNVCSMPNTSYLELGCSRGSTFVSALYGNKENVVNAVTIDNWATGGKEEFFKNCDKFLKGSKLTAYCNDFFEIDVNAVIEDPVNVYFLDGDHSKEGMEMAFTYYTTVLDDVFIAIVDDWNWKDVQEGTEEAFNKLNYTILYEIALPASQNGDTAQWWNGLYVAVVRKDCSDKKFGLESEQKLYNIQF